MKLELRKPLVSNYISQRYGISTICLNSNNIKQYSPKINGVCPAGFVDLYNYYGMQGHSGLDYPVPMGTPCYASHDGIVTEICTEVERGLGIGISTKEKFETLLGEHCVKTRYWHLMAINVQKDQLVKAGDLIGLCDNTGVSTASHLHYELKPIIWKDDKDYKNIGPKEDSDDKDYKNIYQDNGYNGGIDPEPYFKVKEKPFLTNLSYGMREHPEVVRLQQFLKDRGYFTYHTNTGNYFGETMKAVLAFQLEHVQLSWYERYVRRGSDVGPKTRSAINNLIK